MSVRQATKEDIPAVLKLLEEFHAESLNAYKLYLNEEVAKSIMEKFYATSLVLEMDSQIVGVLGGMIVTYPLSNEAIYQELVWFVTKKYRLYGVHLFKTLEKYCLSNNIFKIGVTLMSNSKAQKLERFYEMMGYEYLEKHYIKSLRGDNAKG